MNKIQGIVFSVLAAGLCIAANAQAVPAGRGWTDNGPVDISLTYSNLHTNAPVGTCNCFWMNGGTADVAFPVGNNLYLVGEAGGHTISKIPKASFTGLSLFTAMGGLRLRIPTHTKFQPYGQALIGATHGFHSQFPHKTSDPLNPVAYTTSDTSFGMVLGGGLDWAVSRHFWVRLPQLDYHYSQLLNHYSGRNQQNQFRMSAGVVYRF